MNKNYNRYGISSQAPTPAREFLTTILLLFAAAQAKLAFILNVVIDAFAGDSEKAHVKGCQFVLNMSQVKKNPTDLVITTNGGRS